jgi:solute carrier family 9B (sodium/hydrogen exchanger), member 1/2
MDQAKKDEFYASVGNFVLIGLLFGTLDFLWGDEFMLIGGPGWSCYILWITSLCCGMFCKHYKIPPLLGNLLSGIILKNLPGKIVDGLPITWAAAIRSLGLSLILMRSGLELDVPMVMQKGWIAIRLTIMPGFIEAMTCGGLAVALWGMPPALGFSLGFILAAVSPAVVVSGMFNLQKKGFGIAKGIPSLVVAAASFDDVVAISGYSIAIGFAIQSKGADSTMSALEGPLNIVAGVIVGILGGIICGFTRLFNTKGKRVAVCLFMGFFLMFMALHFHFHGAGALAGLMTTITASYCWQNDALAEYRMFPYMGVSNPNGANHHWHHETEHMMAKMWDMVASPLLFATIGASIDFKVLDMQVIPKAILIVVGGMCVRVPAAFFATGGKNLSNIERLFVGLAWIPKATVQAALGSVPLDLVKTSMGESHPDYEEYKAFGEQILVTAVVAILLTAPLGLICINTFGDKWLNNDIDNPIEEDEHHSDDDDELGDIELITAEHESDDDKENGQVNVTRSESSSAADSGVIKNLRQKSFVGAVADIFVKIVGDESSSSAVMNSKLKKREKTVKPEKVKDNWVFSEQRKRMTDNDVKLLNARLCAHYFHNLTNHIESLQNILDDDDEDIDLLRKIEMSHSCAKVMAGTMACYKIINSMESNFPAERLYNMLDDSNSSMTSTKDRKARRVEYDYINGQVVVDESTGVDPVAESLATLQRRDADAKDQLRNRSGSEGDSLVNAVRRRSSNTLITAAANNGDKNI